MASRNSGYKMQKSINISELKSIGYFNIDDSFADRIESREDWELIYVDKGECSVSVEGEVIPLHQGELYFHKPFESHMLQSDKGKLAQVMAIRFRSSSVAMGFFECKKMQADVTTKQHIADILQEANNTFVIASSRQGENDIEYRSDRVLWAGDQTVLLRLELMLIELIRADGAFSDRPNPYFKKEVINDDLCLKVVEYMEIHLTEKLSMDGLSKALSFSKSYISKRFSSVCECSIIDYFNMMKINEAKRLIKETNKNFFEIAEMLTFSNSHYFSTLFKKHTGMTPTEYKKYCLTEGITNASDIDGESGTEN